MSAWDADADAANEAGRELANAGRWLEAAAFYEKAMAREPGWFAPHLNLGIALKHAKQWTRSLTASLRAYELDPDEASEGALWNAGIAATAIGDWAAARRAWTKVGINLPMGEGPIDMNIGTTPIRIARDTTPEVVWCHRIDPARARIESIPLPESGRRYHDLLLHDGEPVGSRRLGAETVSVFNELEVLEPSPFRTYTTNVIAPSAKGLAKLVEAFKDEPAAAIEDWTANITMICKACSEGLPHEHAEQREEPPWQPRRTIAIATTNSRALEILFAWVGASKKRSATTPELVVPTRQI
jgi:tetratricopeptide (TPR) repeat protein